MTVSGNWVWRHDGTLQCGLGQEQTIEEAADELATLIGKSNILNGEKRTLPGMIITLCGAPTGQVNAFELTDEGYYLLMHGFPGPMGYRTWVETVRTAQETSPLPDIELPEEGSVRVIGAGGDPIMIEDLYGRICRVYNTGDPLTKDYIRRRVNIELLSGRIRSIWFG